jgi:hypothetical protein
VRAVEAEARQALDPKEARARALRFVEMRWGSGPASGPGTIGGEVRRCAKTSGLVGTVHALLEAAARRHETIARALQLAARAARGEDIRKLADEDIST